MKVGIFVDTYSPQINGVVTSVKLLKKELEKKGHSVLIVTVTHPEAKEEESEVFRLPSIPFPPLPEHRIGSFYSQQVLNRIKELELDVIHTQTEFSAGIFGRIAAKFLNLPVVHTYHTMYEDYVHYIIPDKLAELVEEPASKLAQKVSKFYCKGCSTVIAPTEKAKKALQSYGVETDIEIIPTGIDLNPFKEENYSQEEVKALKKELGISRDVPVVLYLGRLAQEKSIDVIIKHFPELLAELPEAKFLIVGGGPEKKELEKLAEELEISSSVIFAGEQPWEEIGKYYQLGDVFVSASTTETQGLTFVEAMASKTPVAAKYDKNLEDMVTDKVNGRIFYQDEELADVLFELITDKAKARELAEKAYEAVQVMSAENFGKRVEEVYKKVTGKI